MIDEIAFLDLENIPFMPVEKFTSKTKLFIIVGYTQAQSKTALAIAQKAIESAASIEMIKVKGQSPNALDFYIAYYLAIEITKNPLLKYCIYSNDTGYDPLVAHLNAEGIRITRASLKKQDAFEPKPEKQPSPKAKKGASKQIEKETINEFCEKAINKLASIPKKNRPKKISSLMGSIKTVLGNKNTIQEIESIYKLLIKRGIITLDGEKVIFTET
jgi:hypothetical protein